MNTTTISAADFIDRIMTGGRFHVGERYVVVGEVSLRGAVLQRPLLLHGFLFEGPVDLSDTVVPGGFDISDCRLRRNVKLSQMHVQGSIRFRRVRVDVEAFHRDGSGGVGIEAIGLEADGDVRIQDLDCRGGVHASGLSVGGAAIWQNIEVARDLDISGSRIGGQCQFSQCNIHGEANMMGLAVRSFAAFDRTDIDGDFSLVSARVEEGLYIGATRVKGILHLANANMAALQIERLAPEVSGSHFGAISAYGLEMSLGFKLCGASIGPHPSDPSEPVLSLGRMKADHIQFWRASLYWKALLQVQDADPEVRSRASNAMLTDVNGDIEIDGSRIDRTIDMTGLVTNGDVNISNSQIGGEVLARSPLTLKTASASRRSAHAILQAAAEGQAGTGAPRRASFRSLNVEDCKIGTDLDLSGLDLAEGLNAQHVSVSGTVILAEAGERVPEAFMNCPGRADFSGARIYKLQASGSSFNETQAGSGSLACGLIMDDAEITLLRLFPKRGMGKAETYPKPLGVSNLTVRHWKLLDDENEDFRSESEEARTFLRLLKNDARISRTTYLSIVATLRNQGHERASSSVFRGLSWRTLGINVRQTLGQLTPQRALYLPVQAGSWLLQAVYGVLLGFGTAPLRLGALILGVAFLSYVSVYNLDENLELRSSGEGEAARFTAAIGENACTDWQKMLVMLRHHIPVAVSEESQTCRLRPHGSVEAAPPVWFSDDRPTAVWPLSPLEFGLYMRLLALMLWPPFLAFALKRAFRE